MFFRVPGNGGSVLKIISGSRSAHRAFPAAGAQVSSDTSAEAIWAQWQDRKVGTVAGLGPHLGVNGISPLHRAGGMRMRSTKESREVFYSAAFSEEWPRVGGCHAQGN